jgi:molecular chaperone IbpA
MYNDLNKFFIGFDEITNKLARMGSEVAKTNYPPFNIVKLDKSSHVIELALAGFSKKDLDVELLNGVLTIKGAILQDMPDEKQEFPQYVWKGISNRAFTKQFNLAENVEVDHVELQDGLLSIFLETIEPKTKGKKIDIA